MPAYSYDDVVNALRSDIPREYVALTARVEQQTYAPTRYPSVKRDWPANGKHVGLLQVSPGLLLDSGALKFSASQAARIRKNVRTGDPIPDIVADIKARDSAAVQAAAIDWTWMKVRNKVDSAPDFYFYHNQGIYARRKSTAMQSALAKSVLSGKS